MRNEQVYARHRLQELEFDRVMSVKLDIEALRHRHQLKRRRFPLRRCGLVTCLLLSLVSCRMRFESRPALSEPQPPPRFTTSDYQSFDGLSVRILHDNKEGQDFIVVFSTGGSAPAIANLRH